MDKKEYAKLLREERKIIESHLHPTPTRNGIEILHKHKGQYIVFTAWKGQDKINELSIEFRRSHVLHCNDFYKDYLDYIFKHLTEEKNQ